MNDDACLIYCQIQQSVLLIGISRTRDKESKNKIVFLKI